jgi:hypothetical protein
MVILSEAKARRVYEYLYLGGPLPLDPLEQKLADKIARDLNLRPKSPTKLETWFLLYNKESADEQGLDNFFGRTTDKHLAMSHYENGAKVIIVTDTTVRLADKYTRWNDY